MKSQENDQIYSETITMDCELRKRRCANTLIQPQLNQISWPLHATAVCLPVMELPHRKEPNEDSQRRAARRKYNVQLEQSNLDTFLQQQNIDVSRLKRLRLEPEQGGSGHGAHPNESTLHVHILFFCRVLIC